MGEALRTRVTVGLSSSRGFLLVAGAGVGSLLAGCQSDTVVATSGCTKDNDCKADRICVGSRCESGPATSCAPQAALSGVTVPVAELAVPCAPAVAVPCAPAVASPSGSTTEASLPGLDACCAKANGRLKATCEAMNVRVKAGTMARSAAVSVMRSQHVTCH